MFIKKFVGNNAIAKPILSHNGTGWSIGIVSVAPACSSVTKIEKANQTIAMAKPIKHENIVLFFFLIIYRKDTGRMYNQFGCFRGSRIAYRLDLHNKKSSKL